MKTGVYLKWTLWKRIEFPLLTFEIEPTRHWTSWDEKWDEDDQAEHDESEANDIIGWNNTPGWMRPLLSTMTISIWKTLILMDGMLKNGTSYNKARPG